MTYDVMIKNGTIVDGTGAPSYVGDVAISDDKIVAVGEPAALYDLQGRGSLVPGAFADINVIDFDALKLRGVEYWHNLPAGAGRFTQKAEGYRHMFVNGQHFMQDGEHAGALAGTVLRSR